MSTTVAVLERVTAVPGVRGALLVSTDGLIVVERVMDGVDARAVAALAASLVARLARATTRAGLRTPTFLHLKGETGIVLAAPGPDELTLIAVAGPEANVGLARLEMLDAVDRLA